MNLLYVLATIRKRGLRFVLTYLMESIWFDLQHGTKTSSRVPKEQQSIASTDCEMENGLLYVASFTSVTRKALKISEELLGSNRFSQAQFFDLGCGKGKALLVYALTHCDSQIHPCVGIEYDPSLAKIAHDNISNCGIDESDVAVIADSALNFADHVNSDVLIVYLYNSFQGETFRAVLSELANHAHLLIYVDPAEKDVLHEFGYSVHFSTQGKYNADTWLVASSNLENLNSDVASRTADKAA